MKKIDLIWILVLSIVMIVAIPLSALVSPYLMIILPVGIVLTLFMWEYEWMSITLMFIVLPFLNSSYMTMSIIPVPGLKYSNVLLILIVLGFFASNKTFYQNKKLLVTFFTLHITLFVVSVLRSSYMVNYTWEFWQEDYHPVKYFLSHALVPLLTSVPFIMIVSLKNNRKVINRVINILVVSVVFFSGMIILIYVLFVPKSSNLYEVRVVIAGYLGMHGNNLVDFLISGFGLFLAVTLYKQKPKYWLGILIMLTAVALLNSRAAYAIVVASAVVIIILTKNYRYFIHMLIPVALVIIFIPGVLTRLLWGFDTGAANDITAGRTGDIWGPVIEEVIEEPYVLAFGHGNFGIMNTDAFKNQTILRVIHAHSAYINTVLDTGLVGLVLYLLFFVLILIRLFRKYLIYSHLKRREETHILVGLMISIVSFLIRCLTDGFLLPNLTNSYFYIILAIACVYDLMLSQEQDGGVMNMMGAKYIYRIDDVTAKMDWYWFNRLMEMFDEYNVVPLLGVIPDNKDTSFETNFDEENFFEIMRTLVKDNKAEIAQHGYNHLYYDYKGPAGSIGKPKKKGKINTEFKGLTYAKQYEKLKKGKQILASEGLESKVFMAPSHTFDEVTLNALKDLDFTAITDGEGLFPYEMAGLTFVPQQMWSPIKVYNVGFYTICLHPQDMTEDLYKRILNHLKSGGTTIAFSQAAKINNYGWLYIYNLRYKVRRMISETIITPIRKLRGKR